MLRIEVYEIIISRYYESSHVHKIVLFMKRSCRGQKVHKSVNFVHDLATESCQMKFVNVHVHKHERFMNFTKSLVHVPNFLNFFQQFMCVNVHVDKHEMFLNFTKSSCSKFSYELSPPPPPKRSAKRKLSHSDENAYVFFVKE